jgi:hypothetical protein
MSLPLANMTCLSHAAADGRHQGQDHQQDKKVQDLPIDLSLHSGTFHGRIPIVSSATIQPTLRCA